jgi:homoserine kinase
MQRFTIRVPGTTSNLGPGFDALGLAVRLYNEIVLEPAEQFALAIEGEGASSLPRDRSNVMIAAFEKGCRAIGIEPPTMRWTCKHAIPTARGLGSSASAIVAGFMAADAVGNGALGRDRVLAMTTEIEGHPDNAAPAVFGGLQSSVLANGRVLRITVPTTNLPRMSLFIPDFELATRDARAVLPASLTRGEAVHNISRTALLVAALAAGDTTVLDEATRDVLHQPARTKLFPSMPMIFEAARAAGSTGVWLSGAGSTLAAFASDDRAIAVAEAMKRTAGEHGVSGRALVADVDRDGAVWSRS